MTKTNKSLGHLRGVLVAVISLTTLTACGQFSKDSANTLVNDASPSVGCESFESDFYDSLYKMSESTQNFPTEQEVSAAFAGKNLSPALTDELTALYRLLAVDGLRKLGQENASGQDKLASLSSMEIGDRTTPEKDELQTQIKAEFAKVKALSSGNTCGKPADDRSPASDSGTNADNGGNVGLGDTATPPNLPTTSSPKAGTLFAQWKATKPRLIYGALKAMSTAYQSCDSAQVPALGDEQNNAVGISIVGKHPDGIGNKRLITNMNDFMKSNPYLQNYRKPNSGCYDVTKNVPIYDYGGRPATSSGTINFFSNSGSGTAALGTDCSGYVGTSIAAAGLRAKKATAMKATFVAGVNSSMWMNPQKNGLTCFDYVNLTSTSTMRVGDIIAKHGHIVMVDSVGSDPLGIAKFKSASECTLANVSVSRFDFTIIQDSPWKGGLGVQRSVASTYFYDPDEAAMKEGLLAAAVVACKAKFGTPGLAKNDKAAITRHSGTSECINASEIAMDHESCVSSCPSGAL